MDSVMVNAGTVVMVMYFMCVNSGVPHIDDASTVVSDNGDI